MADRPIVFEGINSLLAAALTLLGIAAVLLWVGPGMIAVERARTAVGEKEERFAAWDEERESAEATTSEDRRRWMQQFERARTIGIVAGDDASLSARVARRLDAPSVRGLEVARDGGPDEDDERSGLDLAQPFGPLRLDFERVPVRVRFDASYADVKAILERFGPGEGSGMVVRRVDLKRQFPSVRVELELDVWTRREGTS